MWIEVGRCKEDVQKFSIRDLQEGNKYLIRIYARNEIGMSDPLESEEPYEVLHGMGKEMKYFEPFCYFEISCFKAMTPKMNHGLK